ncbi:MAG: hypothetical protein WCO84_06685 [bacterium]
MKKGNTAPEIVFTGDIFRLEIYGKDAIKYKNLIGFNFKRKQESTIKIKNNHRNSVKFVIPNSLKLVKKLYDISNQTTSTLKNNYGLNINGILNKKSVYKTKHISADIVTIMYDLFGELLPDEYKNEYDDNISDNIIWSVIKDIRKNKNETFDFSLPDTDDKWCHSILYNGIIGHQTPNGVGNFFHEEWEKASSKLDDNSLFNPIRLHWSMHPDRDQKWRVAQDKILGPRLAAQECYASFLSSGQTVVGMEDILYYENETCSAPIEERGNGKSMWVWKRPEPGKQYIVAADVARGDASDKSAFHVFDIETMEQIVEYRSVIDTKAFGDILVAIGTEYNDALIVVENSNIGWAVLQQIIDREYKNLYYTQQNVKYIDATRQTSNKLNNMEKKSVPGFSTSPATRPLLIQKLDEYCREKSVILKSKRLISELKVFVWKNGKAQAMTDKYNDDLVMSLGILLWVRDTSLDLFKQVTNIQRALLSGVKKSANPYDNIISGNNGLTYVDQWSMTLNDHDSEDLTQWI